MLNVMEINTMDRTAISYQESPFTVEELMLLASYRELDRNSKAWVDALLLEPENLLTGFDGYFHDVLVIFTSKSLEKF